MTREQKQQIAPYRNALAADARLSRVCRQIGRTRWTVSAQQVQQYPRIRQALADKIAADRRLFAWNWGK